MALGQTLHERNPTSHLIWWVAGVALALVGVAVLFEVVDWFRYRTRRSGTAETVKTDWKLKEPESALRERFFRRQAPRQRLWPWGDGLPLDRPSKEMQHRTRLAPEDPSAGEER